VHQVKRRFKIGISQEPLQRLALLPEGALIDYLRSQQSWLPSTERAREMELGLHRLLRPWNQRKHCEGDGYTEWFHTEVWEHAMALVEAAPWAGRELVGMRLESVLMGAVPDLQVVQQAGAMLQPPLCSMTRMLYEAAEHCYVQAVRQHGLEGEFCGLRLWDLRHNHQGPMHTLRYRLMDPQAYEVDSGSRPCSLLAGPIQWARQRSSDLWIPLQPPSHWRRNEELGHLCPALRGVARRLDELGRRWHKVRCLMPARAELPTGPDRCGVPGMVQRSQQTERGPA
jgi:hypothetical protein